VGRVHDAHAYNGDRTAATNGAPGADPKVDVAASLELPEEGPAQ
jgi:hypothetical protein